ncbi:importin-4 [Drosophila mauritiana]|uniref:Importin-4 n=1 Tax=Drosophila mauritiana TaxID=7226 RepID=A0A6P8JWR6_DROMA|nr:importin-4 [Drosophila mauritiana]
MEAAILDIINGILAMDTERIRESTDKMLKAYENPDSLLVLTQIIMSDRPVQERQVAAVLLKRRVKKLRHWQLVPAEHQAAIKSNMLQVLIAVKEKTVKGTVAFIIGSLVRHEEGKQNSWREEILKFIYERCSSPDPTESERGSSIFSTLMDAAPDQFSNYTDTIFPLLAGILVTAEANGNMATPTVHNMLAGICFLLPFVSGHSNAEQIVVKAVPLILKALGAFAEKGDSNEFMGSFDIMDSMAEYVPHLLTGNVKLILEFCLTIARNKQVDASIRVQVITFVGSLIRLKKKIIMKQKLLQPTLSVIFEVICQDVLDDDDDYFSSESLNSPSNAAAQTLDLMALHMVPDKFIPPLLELLEPALQSPEPVLRRSSFICMGVIAEGCSEAIGKKYLQVMLNIIKAGVLDSVMLVRTAAFFALGQFSEFLQPTICKFAPQILPVLFDYLSQLVMELKIGTPNPKHMDRMFYALETFCENLDEEIVPYLPTLMDRLFGVMEPQNTNRMREMGLSAIAAVSTAAKEHLMPYFPRIMTVLQGCLVKDCPKEMDSLRIQAIDTLAELCREVGKDNIIPLADDTMNFCLMMLEDGPDDPEFRRSIYNLMSSLSSVVNESMASVFPKFIDRIMESVISSEDMVPNVSDNAEDDLALEDAANIEIDLEHTDDEDDQDAYLVENDYIIEKEEAIMSLKEFATHTGAAFAPYLQSAFENVYKMIDHPQSDVRMACIDSICAFITALHKLNDAVGLKRACEIAIPKFAHIMRTDDQVGVVNHLLDVLYEVFKNVPAINSQEHAELIFACIRDIFTNEMACQFNEESGGGDDEYPEESENEEMLFENAANLFPMFGLTIQPELFSLYFGRLYHFYIQRLAKVKDLDLPEGRAFVYGALADCCRALKGCCATYFDALRPIFIAGSKDSDGKARQNSYFALGEIVFHSEEKSLESYPTILQALSEAIVRESVPAAMDNICGAVARLIVTDLDSVPLGQVLPVWLNHLPLKEDTVENDVIQKAFRVLYLKARPSIEAHLEQILAITIESSYKKQMPDVETTQSAVALIKEISANYPELFNKVSNMNPEVFNYVQAL